MKSRLFFIAAGLMLLSAIIVYFAGLSFVASLGFAGSSIAFLGAGFNYLAAEKKNKQ